MTLQENYPLLPHNTFGIAATCRWFAQYASEAELQELLRLPLLANHPFFHIGSGSNLLFVANYKGVILHSLIRHIEVVSETEQGVTVNVGAGVVWDDFVAYAVAQEWGGVENLSHIPGEVGASAVQNIGAYGVEAKDVILQVNTLAVATGECRRFTQPECQYGYRQSIFKGELKGQYIVTSVTFELSKQPTFNLSYGNLQEQLGGAPPTLQLVRDTIVAIRAAKLPDPAVLGNAGSFFMNPIIPLSLYNSLKERYPDMPHYPVNDTQVKVPAGWLIDRAGWKGRSHKGAAVHQHQALVLVNSGSATASDVVELAAMIQRSVHDTYQIEITPEVNYIGE